MSLDRLIKKLNPAFLDAADSKPCRLFLSASDMKSRAITRHAIADNPEDAFNAALAELKPALRGIKSTILRADWVVSSEEMTWQDFLKLIGKTRRNYFRLGVALDTDFNIAFTESELNANVMLFKDGVDGKKNCVFREEQSNNYCRYRFGCDLPKLKPESPVVVFKTAGIFISDEEKIPLKISNDGLATGHREVSHIDSELFLRLARNGAAHLASQVKNSGQFIYGYWPCFNKIVPSYNTLRHFSTVAAMLDVYETYGGVGSMKLSNAINKAIKYATSNFVTRRKLADGSEVAYIFDVDNECKLGANGIAILALAKHARLMKTKKFLPLMNDLARGLITMQKPDGSFVHILNADDFSVKEEFRIVYYDGEAVLGILRLYSITRDENLLAVAEKAFKRFIETNHWQNHDHWLSYAVNELTTYQPKREYFEFGINNFLAFLPFIYHRDTQYPTLLELMTEADTMLERMKTMPEMADLLAKVNFDDFYAAMESRAKNLLNGYFYPELAMFFKKPDSIAGSFFIRHQAFRVRIDDVQHFLSGFVSYRRYLARRTRAPQPSKELLESKAEGTGIFNIQASDKNAIKILPDNPPADKTIPVAEPILPAKELLENKAEGTGIFNIQASDKNAIKILTDNPPANKIVPVDELILPANNLQDYSNVSIDCPKDRLMIFFGGDVVIGRRMNWNINLNKNPFGNLKIMSEADLRIVNLECVVAAQGQQGINKGEGGPYYYHARPEQINLLTEAHIDIALTANNHSKDYYEAALFEQNNYLDRAGIIHLGTGADISEASKPIFTKVKGFTVALFNVDATMKPFAATDKTPGVFYLPPNRPELWLKFFTEQIAEARRKADIVLVAPHWGLNGVKEPSDQLKILGRLLIDCGADAVLGCHSHLVHGVENYKQRPIIYDAGNFVFDSNSSLGGAFSIVLSERGVEEVFFTPLLIGFCKTLPANKEQAEKIGGQFLDSCRKFGTDAEVLEGGLIKLTFEPPAREKRILDPVELSSSRLGEKILPMTEPLKEWTAEYVPEEAQIEPQQFGELRLTGCRIMPECMLMKRRQMLFVETYWTIAQPTDKDFKIRILGVPAIKDAMPNFGEGMDHQGCDWMWPTNRWKSGVIYYEKFGLRPPGFSNLVNVDVQLQISVLDGKVGLGKYIHTAAVKIQIPNRPTAVPTIAPATESDNVQSQTSLPTIAPATESDIYAFRRAFKARKGVIFFMLRHLKANASGLELSALRRATLFKNYLGCEVFLLTNEYQATAIENFARYKADGKLLNMYDYFQEINRELMSETPAQLPEIPPDCRVEYLGSDMRVRRNGRLLMYCAFDPDNNKLRYINFFDNGKKIRRDTYDSLGFLSRRQILDPESAMPTEALYYKPGGTIAIRELYEVINKESKLKSIELAGTSITVDSSRKLMQYWLERLTSDNSRTYFLIGDRSPEYTRFYVDVKRRGLENIFVLHQLHSLHVLADFNPMTAPTKRWYNFLTDLTLKSDAVITLTEQQKIDIIKRYGLSNVTVIPHAMREQVPATVIREPFKIVMVGRLVEEKGSDKALEAFKIVHSRIPQAKLHFYGVGPMAESLKQNAQSAQLGDAVVFEGFKSNIGEVFSSATLSVVASRCEGFSLTVQESLQNNCPVVSFDCNYGPRDMIEDGVNGYLVAVNDIEAMADRIIKILDDPELREKLAANCAQTLDKFSAQVVANKWARLMHALMEKSTLKKSS